MRWDRIARVALVIAIFFVLASYVRPLVNLIDGYSESRTETSRLERLRQQNQVLDERAQALKTPEAATRAARSHGLVSAGERPYVINGLGK